MLFHLLNKYEQRRRHHHQAMFTDLRALTLRSYLKTVFSSTTRYAVQSRQKNLLLRSAVGPFVDLNRAVDGLLTNWARVVIAKNELKAKHQLESQMVGVQMMEEIYTGRRGMVA